MKEEIIFYLRATLAGILIGLGGAIYLKVGGVVGAFMFSFGLICVIKYKLPLYTGICGFVKSKRDMYKALMSWIFNFVGCKLLSLLPISGISAVSIARNRMEAGYLNSFLLAVGCGFIMTLIVKAARENSWLPLLLGIPLFILVGFYHSIADAYYFCLCPDYGILVYLVIVAGNFVGCNVPRVLMYDHEQK